MILVVPESLEDTTQKATKRNAHGTTGRYLVLRYLVVLWYLVMRACREVHGGWPDRLGGRGNEHRQLVRFCGTSLARDHLRPTDPTAALDPIRSDLAQMDVPSLADAFQLRNQILTRIKFDPKNTHPL